MAKNSTLGLPSHPRIARSIKEFLKARGISQNELAQRMGCTPANASRMLSSRGNMTLSTLDRISVVLGHDFLGKI